ncbi:hypothetical protein JB92DRAFT_3149933 [Gautieria morchelliformis]|nr:hypothetical protein JB92DRAFT_3149933 [Gautieria morchelliformis]
MRVVNHDPSDPYAKPPLSMQNSTLRKRWHKLAAETREAFWKELEDGSTTEPESDEELVDPRSLLHGKRSVTDSAPSRIIRILPRPDLGLLTSP